MFNGSYKESKEREIPQIQNQTLSQGFARLAACNNVALQFMYS